MKRSKLQAKIIANQKRSWLKSFQKEYIKTYGFDIRLATPSILLYEIRYIY